MESLLLKVHGSESPRKDSSIPDKISAAGRDATDHIQDCVTLVARLPRPCLWIAEVFADLAKSGASAFRMRREANPTDGQRNLPTVPVCMNVIRKLPRGFRSSGSQLRVDNRASNLCRGTCSRIGTYAWFSLSR